MKCLKRLSLFSRFPYLPAQSFLGSVNHTIIRIGTIDAQTMKYSQGSWTLRDGKTSDDLTLTLTDSGNGYGTVVGDLTSPIDNFSLHFSGNLLAPTPGKQYMGHVPISGSIDLIGSQGAQETHTFSASGNVRIVVFKDKSGNVKYGVITLKLSPYNETNSASGNPEIMTITISATKILPQ